MTDTSLAALLSVVFVVACIRRPLAENLFLTGAIRSAAASVLALRYRSHADETADERQFIVAPPGRSPANVGKVSFRRTDDGLPVHSFRGFINDLVTLCLDRAQPAHKPEIPLRAADQTDAPSAPRLRIARRQPRDVVSTSQY